VQGCPSGVGNGLAGPVATINWKNQESLLKSGKRFLVSDSECLKAAAMMNNTLGQGMGYGPVVLTMALTGGLVATILALSWVLGPKRQGPIKSIPYESGLDPVGSTRRRFHVRFYLVAVLFLLFDVELVFLYPWAVAFHASRQAGAGGGYYLVGMLIFTAILLVALIYEWRRGGLDWR
jgi:NADH-quinone oxidoreductase subunit A